MEFKFVTFKKLEGNYNVLRFVTSWAATEEI